MTPGAVVNAVSEDGLIEVIEFSDYKFAMEVQWHPELLFDKDEFNMDIFILFVDKCK